MRGFQGRGGRGAYYKQRYGGGGRRGQAYGGGGRGQADRDNDSQSLGHNDNTSTPAGGSRDWDELIADLRAIDRQPYAYNSLLGTYEHVYPSFELSVDHIQGDPYAAPSRVRTRVAWTDTTFPNSYLESDIRRIALCDFVTRVAGSIIQTRHLDQNVGIGQNSGWSAPKGGAFSICLPGQEIIPRTSAMTSTISGGKFIELRFTVSLPAAGRSILGQQAVQILALNLVDVVKQSLFHGNLDQRKLEQHVLSAELQHSLRLQLRENDLIAFVGNGSVLPRASGASQVPMSGEGVVAFQSPKELEITLTASNGQHFKGMGIPRGVTMLTGGGFHGKSTLLEALELGIYDHIPSDGREVVVTDPTAFKVRAEDGRSISKTDISPFISHLPGGKDTALFSTEDASGSTSMAANIQEALEAGCKTLLIDEDSSATNLLVRDGRMQALIRNEPITPLVSKTRALYDQHGVSTVIVIGGLGDWLSVADHVVAMDSYVPRVITQEAQEVVRQHPSAITLAKTYGSIPARTLKVDFEGMRTPYATRHRFIAMKSLVHDAVNDPSHAESGVDLSGLDQIVEIGQSRLIAVILERIATLTKTKTMTLDELCDQLNDVVGISKPLSGAPTRGDLVAVRRIELAAAVSRLRGLALRVDKAAIPNGM